MSRNYPVTSQIFAQLREGDAVYVDKTQFLVPLLSQEFNAAFFLSRPRRFGKSMIISTLEAALSGQKELFKGLYLYDKIDWIKYPVIRFSMDKLGNFGEGFKNALFFMVSQCADKHQIVLKSNDYAPAFAELIEKIYDKYQQRVVILIDEYDKPIIQGLEGDNVSLAETNRDILKPFYGVLKPSGDFLRFTFITGVSRIAKVSIFSDLNHLSDITLNEAFSTICGFTEAEIRQYCRSGLEELAQKEGVSVDAIMAKIRYWYNGFSWDGINFVYNPYSTMHLMQYQQFDNYWVATGTPTFLTKMLRLHTNFKMKSTKVHKMAYNLHDFRKWSVVSMMLQTGYLTFKEPLGDDFFMVYYPNKEVEESFTAHLLGEYADKDPSEARVTASDVREAFLQNKPEQVIAIMTDLFKTLPQPFFFENVETVDKAGNTKIVRKSVTENFYHAIIYLIFNILSVRMNAEILSSEGRIDAVVETDSHIYIFEFKKGKHAQEAIDQMIQKGYPDLYRLSKKQIVLMGVGFTAQKRGVSDFKIMPYLPVSAWTN
ncbi:MAG: hypothetical protein RLZZ628_3189 [Bacteroidota bacterium]